MDHPFRADDVDVTPAEVQRRHAAGEIQLIDVREPYERDAGYIAGSRHIELERLASNAETLPRDRAIVFHCRLGARSALATRAFRSAGYDAWSMRGGIQAWHDLGLPVAGRGEVADH